ncbi:hypothetical protein ACH4TC_09960 [Streptomyces spororaveus]|uniref:hypothetical protein n=1 Tax=Streptomyces spororaveus TaxID=284039 RepID=UPI0037A6920F
MPNVVIDSVYCAETTDGFGSDQLYIKIDDVQIYGTEEIDAGDNRIINVGRSFGVKAKVSLWEYDSGSADDHIGSFWAHQSQVGEGQQAVTLTGDDSHYDVHYTVTE